VDYCSAVYIFRPNFFRSVVLRNFQWGQLKLNTEGNRLGKGSERLYSLFMALYRLSVEEGLLETMTYYEVNTSKQLSSDELQ